MGVPAFFRWLSRKYPSVIIECLEEKQYNTDDGKPVPQDSTKPNPNGVEFDNLYLDMNGIIHPCTHPEDKPAPKDEDEMMAAIFECIDRLFNIVRPRKLLYMAIDGVAPRAKMNQQRSRRFRASKEAIEKKAEVARIRAELLEKGYRVPPEKPKESHFDSNCITPGTPFMDRLSRCLHYYVHDRLNTDAGWRGIKVILSDANVPGEGEHKIMDYIRRQRAQPDHDPNTQHVLCGADADLIMLGLATHEVNFTIIREEFKPNKPKPCDICGQLGHELKECVGVAEGDEGEPEKVYDETRYIFVRLNVLREYLERELYMPDIPFKYDFDRAIDDWVFMCFFVGNDFLPHLPSLEIRENAIDRLVRLYKECCLKTGGWLTDSGAANMERVQYILTNLGRVEDEIFRTRQRRELEFRAREKTKRKQEKMEKEAAKRFKDETGKGALRVMPAGQTAVAHGAKQAIMSQRYGNMVGQKRTIDEVDSDDEEETPDEVRLFEPGFKDRYYESKFEVLPNNVSFRRRVADEYARGLSWVLKYYYQGCVSWDWYFPYHYAPFASDFINCANANTVFSLGEPFNPLEQLMGVFPAASRSHVPEPWGELMIDPESVIIDFYPEDFKIDLNGKKFAWQGVALLPFVDEKRLKKALKSVYPLLTPEEIRRNKRGDDRMYVSVKHPAYSQMTDLYRMGLDMQTEVPIAGTEFQGIQGKVLLASDVVEPLGTLRASVRGMDDVRNNQVVTVRFRDPRYSPGFIFPARKLPKAEDPPRVLKPQDLDAQQNKNYRPVIGFNRNLPRASLDMSGHRSLGHLLPNLQGTGLPSNMPLLEGDRAGQGLLGAGPGLLPTPPCPWGFPGYPRPGHPGPGPLGPMPLGSGPVGPRPIGPEPMGPRPLRLGPMGPRPMEPGPMGPDPVGPRPMGPRLPGARQLGPSALSDHGGLLDPGVVQGGLPGHGGGQKGIIRNGAGPSLLGDGPKHRGFPGEFDEQESFLCGEKQGLLGDGIGQGDFFGDGPGQRGFFGDGPGQRGFFGDSPRSRGLLGESPRPREFLSNSPRHGGLLGDFGGQEGLLGLGEGQTGLLSSGRGKGVLMEPEGEHGGFLESGGGRGSLLGSGGDQGDLWGSEREEGGLLGNDPGEGVLLGAGPGQGGILGTGPNSAGDLGDEGSVTTMFS